MAADLLAPTSSTSTPADPPANIVLVGAGSDADMSKPCRAISFASDGDIKVTTVGGQTLVIPSGSLAALMQHSMRLSRIWATGTTATGIIAYY